MRKEDNPRAHHEHVVLGMFAAVGAFFCFTLMFMFSKLLSASYATPDGEEVRWTLSFDTFRKVYRLTEFSSSAGYMDIEEGTFDDAGKLTLSNVATELPYLVADLTVFSRFSVSELSADGFKIEREASIDGGESWFVAVEEVYTRKP